MSVRTTLTPEAIVAQILIALPERETSRQIIAIAGPPAVGKSTTAEAVVAALGEEAALVPMDGFHLDNTVLDTRGLRDVKGAPQTFDMDGFAALITRLHSEDNVVFPRFDRARDIAIAGCGEVTKTHHRVVVEGNYLLLDAPGWRDLAAEWDFSVFMSVPENVLEDRLIERWRSHGLDAETARAKAENNDLPNARTVMRSFSGNADLIVNCVQAY